MGNFWKATRIEFLVKGFKIKLLKKFTDSNHISDWFFSNII